MKASIIVPKEYVGAVMELNNDRRGTFDHMEYLSPERVHLTYELPLGEIVLDFYDQLKSRTRGYASFDYDFIGFRPGDARARRRARRRRAGRRAVADHPPRLRVRPRPRARRAAAQEIPRQMFDVAIQAAIGARVIARETVKARRKDVLAKCYGGDITRKRKLLEKQKKGKKRMKQVGAVEVPQEAFLAVLNLESGTASRVSGVRHLYVHLPFCAHRCGYCDFVTVVGRERQHDAYVDALLRELELERGAARRELETIFLGGGTPTFTAPAALERLLAALPRAREVTVEANPETVTPELARASARNRVNRVSLGAQTFNAAVPARARAPRAARTTSSAPSTFFGCRISTTSRSISSTGSRARAPPTSSATSRRARARARAPLLLRARGEAGHALHPCARAGARAPGRRDGGLLRARRRAADRPRATAGTRRRTSADAAGGRDLRARHNLGVLARPRLPRARDRRRLDNRGPAVAEHAAAAGYLAALARGERPPREHETLDDGRTRARARDARAAPRRAAAARRPRGRARRRRARAARAARARRGATSATTLALTRARPLPRRRRHGRPADA